MRYVDQISMFEPLSEEEQKDFLFIMLQSMDEQADKSVTLKGARKTAVLRDVELMKFFAIFFLQDPYSEMFSEMGIDGPKSQMLKRARDERTLERTKGEA